MLPFLGAAALAFGAIFVAEFGDKSQLLILAFATRYPAKPVILGVVVAASIIQGISVAVGAAAGELLPSGVVEVVAGLAFLGVAAWTLVGEDEGEADAVADGSGRLAGITLVITVAATFVASELGDKTMLATFALAAQQGPLPTWIGSTAGEVAANLVAVAVGSQAGHRLSPRAIRIGSAALFALAGVAILAGTFLG